MKARTEAARLFFAISALILVGMLSGNLGANLAASTPEENSKISVTSQHSKVAKKSHPNLKRLLLVKRN